MGKSTLFLQRLNITPYREGFEITLLNVHENGVITAREVETALRDDTCLVTVMYANNEIGTIQPISEIGAVCRKHGVLFYTDAVQAAGHLPIHVGRESIQKSLPH